MAAGAAQVRLGWQVSMLQADAYDPEGRAEAEASGIQLIHVPTNAFRFDPKAVRELVASNPPLVNLHSVFVPQQVTLAHALSKAGIPFIITAHGGLAPPVLARNPIRKLIYSHLVEKRRGARPWPSAWSRPAKGTGSGTTSRATRGSSDGCPIPSTPTVSTATTGSSGLRTNDWCTSGTSTFRLKGSTSSSRSCGTFPTTKRTSTAPRIARRFRSSIA